MITAKLIVIEKKCNNTTIQHIKSYAKSEKNKICGGHLLRLRTKHATSCSARVGEKRPGGEDASIKKQAEQR
jgi:hypothetical protein